MATNNSINSRELIKTNNLSDLTNTTTARTNLGLGTLATQSGTFSGTSSGTNTGDVTVLDSSEIDFTLTGQQITGSLIAGSIANSKLANSAITIAGTSTSLGGSISRDTITGLSSTGIVKRTGANTLAIASAGTDYVGVGAVTTSGLTMSTAKLLGRSTASTGAVEEITVGSGLSLSGGTLSASGGSGESVTKSISQTSHGFSVGDVLKYASSTYSKAQADSGANAEVVGIVSAVADANTFTLLTSGYISTLSGLTANTTYFLSASTAGALTATEPSTVGQISKPLLVAVSTTAGYFTNMRGVAITSSSPGFDPFSGNLIQIDWSASSWSEFGSGGSISYRKASADFTSDGGGSSSRFAYIGSTNGNPLQALVTTGKVTTIQFALLAMAELSESHTFYYRVENAGSETANPPSSTVRHYGFSINNGNVTCSNADGTTATTTASGTITATETLNVFKMVITYGTDVKFYQNGTLLATHTTNLPSATTYRIMTGFVNSDTTSRGYDIGQTTIFSAY